MSCPPKDTKNRSLIAGDFDKDGTKNIDDKYPFDKKRSEQKDELSLANEMRIIRKRALEHRGAINKIQHQIKQDGYNVSKARLKTTTSIINKWRRKYFANIRDIAGIRIYVDSQEEAWQVVDYLKANYNVIPDEVEDVFSQGRAGGYGAIHVIIEEDGNYFEVQISTKEIFEKAKGMHTKYKLGQL